MTVFTCPSPDEMGKFSGVVRAFLEIWHGSIIDVGCRSGNLHRLLCKYNREVHYCGVDFYPPANILADLEKGLPFADKSFDVAIALDVLEHIDNIHKAFGELCRVAKKFVVIALPNAYELKGRINFLLGRPLSGKYGLPAYPNKDRHRWLFSLNEAKAFAHNMGQDLGFEVSSEGYLIGPRRSFPMATMIVELFPNLFSPSYLALFKRKKV
jgi:SAM-dependent methyltransferase